MAISSDGEEDLFLRIVASEDGLEIVASGPNGRREGTIIEPKRAHRDIVRYIEPFRG